MVAETGGDTADTGAVAAETALADTDSTLADTVADTGTPSDSGIADSALADSADTGVDTAAVPDFSLEDLNPGSVRYGEMISPRDYLEQVSGWYFIHST